MNKAFSAILTAAAITTLSFGVANAATTLSWNTGNVGTSYTQDFNGFVGAGTPTVISGLNSQITYKLSSVSRGGKVWTFTYDITNTSTINSRISSFGFDVSGQNPDDVDSTGTYRYANAPGGNIPNGIGKTDVCFKAVSQGTCGGGGNGGLTKGLSGSGTFSLEFDDRRSTLDFTDLYVRYQSVSGPYDSASGVPSAISAVPEPATWAMMITGFGLAGVAVRRRRTQLAFA